MSEGSGGASLEEVVDLTGRFLLHAGHTVLEVTKAVFHLPLDVVEATLETVHGVGALVLGVISPGRDLFLHLGNLSLQALLLGFVTQSKFFHLIHAEEREQASCQR